MLRIKDSRFTHASTPTLLTSYDFALAVAFGCWDIRCGHVSFASQVSSERLKALGCEIAIK